MTTFAFGVFVEVVEPRMATISSQVGPFAGAGRALGAGVAAGCASDFLPKSGVPTPVIRSSTGAPTAFRERFAAATMPVRSTLWEDGENACAPPRSSAQAMTARDTIVYAGNQIRSPS